MNKEYKIANDRKTYISPNIEIVKMDTIDLLAASDKNNNKTNGKKFNGDELDLYDDEIKEKF